MAQFDVYENINKNSKDSIPYLLDIQNDILKDLSTRVVIPLVLDSQPLRILNPELVVNGKKVILSTSELASISLKDIGNKICSLKEKREDIISAVDFLVTGF